MANTTLATSEKIRIRLKAYDHVVLDQSAVHYQHKRKS